MTRRSFHTVSSHPWSHTLDTVYHAVDRYDPYFEGAVGFTKRPVLLDAIDWIDGWPTVRGGLWASDTPQQAPAAQPGQRTNYRTPRALEDVPQRLIPEYSDEFNGTTRDNNGNVRPLRPRSFKSLSEAEEENGQSRIYLGIHWSFDKSDGITQGQQIADYVWFRTYLPTR